VIGDLVRSQGVVFEVIFDGRQPLLDDYSRPSTLGPMSVAPKDRHRNGNKKDRALRPEAVQRAKRDLHELGA
jgi:hypothetical protein